MRYCTNAEVTAEVEPVGLVKYLQLGQKSR